MDLCASHGEVNLANERWLKEKYDAVVGTSGYCLVSLSLKNFLEYSRHVGYGACEEVCRRCYDLLAGCLVDGEHIVRIHSSYFNLLVKCEANEESLHANIPRFHFAVRDGMEARYGKNLYLEIGYYPILRDGVDFYAARYFADLCRLSPHSLYPETNYDMYYVSFQDQKEEFSRFEKKVQRGLERGDFKLYLQPKVELATGQVHAAEVLMRWIDPEEGMIPLSSFLPNLEENGSIRDVDLYLFDKACSYLDKWKKQHGKTMRISFNMSRAYFNGPYFMPEYTAVFEKYNLDPACIRIELLESVVLNELERVQPLVKSIYDYGFTCALDDFGSGFSSFDVLTNVELSELKIDRSLFQNIENPKEKALIKHLVDIAHGMGLCAVAEGIETEAYARYLKEIGCDYIQGFFYFKPMPVEEFEAKFIQDV